MSKNIFSQALEQATSYCISVVFVLDSKLKTSSSSSLVLGVFEIVQSRVHTLVQAKYRRRITFCRLPSALQNDYGPSHRTSKSIITSTKRDKKLAVIALNSIHGGNNLFSCHRLLHTNCYCCFAYNEFFFAP